MTDRRANEYSWTDPWDADAMQRLEDSTKPIGYEKRGGIQDEVYSKEELDCMHFVGQMQDAAIFARNDLKNANLKKIFKEALDQLVAATI